MSDALIRKLEREEREGRTPEALEKGREALRALTEGEYTALAAQAPQGPPRPSKEDAAPPSRPPKKPVNGIPASTQCRNCKKPIAFVRYGTNSETGKGRFFVVEAGVVLRGSAEGPGRPLRLIFKRAGIAFRESVREDPEGEPGWPQHECLGKVGKRGRR